MYYYDEIDSEYRNNSLTMIFIYFLLDITKYTRESKKIFWRSDVEKKPSHNKFVE